MRLPAPLGGSWGRVGEAGVASVVLFAAARELSTPELFAAFWDDEGARLDWLRDFLRDEGTTELFEHLTLEEDEEEEEEILYSRSQLATLGSDVVNGY